MNIKEKISEMTLEEKASLCSGLNFLVYERYQTFGHRAYDGDRRTSWPAKAGRRK